jgi:hypothetical protein
MSNKKAHTTNHSDRNVEQKFDQVQFNKTFENEDTRMILNQKFINSYDIRQDDEIISELLPHQKPIEEIVINIRELFYVLINKFIDRENPIPYIQESPDRVFAFALMIIILGSTGLLLSNILKNNDDK